MRVRHMDWADDLRRLQGRTDAGGSNGVVRDDVGEIVPDVEDSETFDVIIGSDILYEVRHHVPASPHSWTLLKIPQPSTSICIQAIALICKCLFQR